MAFQALRGFPRVSLDAIPEQWFARFISPDKNERAA
jgi:hypothetical protein